MKVVGVIPARYKSTRFPGKPLVEILGVPMIIRVARKLEKAVGLENTYIATDDHRIEKIANQFGYKSIITSEDCLTGTDRVYEFSKKVDADIYVNVQGDEPMVDPNDILNIIEEKKTHPNFVINGMKDLSEEEDSANINIPKVLVNSRNMLLYMSRLSIPGIKSKIERLPKYKKQVCIYAFSADELTKFSSLGKKPEYEAFEDIEILRFFELGIPVKMVETKGTTLAVDEPDDVDKVVAALKRLGHE